MVLACKSVCTPGTAVSLTCIAPDALIHLLADIAASGRSRFFSALPPQVVEHLQTRPYAMENHAHGEWAV